MNAIGVLFEWGVVLAGFELPSLPVSAATAILTTLAGACGALLGVLEGAGGKPTVTADRLTDPEGRARVFRLTLGGETIMLDPGKPWVKTDTYKWVTRGLIEVPQSYHVTPNGTVEINGEKIALGEPTATQRLEHEFNKSHAVGSETRKPPAAIPPTPPPAGTTPPPNRVHFTVKLDHLGHLIVDCVGGSERMELGLRGLSALVQNGLMLRPTSLHVDPLQKSIEIDGHRFECTEAGARGLDELLNTRYAPALKDAGSHVIEIIPNPASATGFDIRFGTLHAGVRVQVKGHLAQDKLDILQDSARCGLLQHGILLKLSPPNLLIRRRRPDGGEEHITELPDIPYRRVTAAQLQQLLNHPLIRRVSGSGPVSTAASTPERSREWSEVLPAPEPSSAPLLSSAGGGLPPTPSPLADLTPQSPPPASPPPEIAEVIAVAKLPAREEPADANAAKGRLPEPPAEMAFPEADPARVNTAVFWSLVQPLDLSVQEVWLDLPHVFENRRFEVLNFNRAAIADITELRSEAFYGFYLTHVDDQNVILVYACQGRHLEWGTRKCVLQPSPTAEAEEFPESALRGLAQDPEGNFVFVVSPRYQAWVGIRARQYLPVCARFLTVEELLEHRSDYSFIWPRRALVRG